MIVRSFPDQQHVYDEVFGKIIAQPTLLHKVTHKNIRHRVPGAVIDEWWRLGDNYIVIPITRIQALDIQAIVKEWQENPPLYALLDKEDVAANCGKFVCVALSPLNIGVPSGNGYWSNSESMRSRRALREQGTQLAGSFRFKAEIFDNVQWCNVRTMRVASPTVFRRMS